MDNRQLELVLNSRIQRLWGLDVRRCASAQIRICIHALICICIGLVMVLSVCMTGCAGKKVEVKPGPVPDSTVDAYRSQRSPIVRTSEDDGRPSWTTETVFEKDGKVYFSGGYLNGSDYPVTIRCANAEALKVAVQSVSQFIRVEFSSFAQGENVGLSGIERYVSDGVAAFTDNLHMQGVRQKDLYYEELFSPTAMRSTFNVWVCLEMSKADYLHAKADVLRKLRDRFQSEGRVEAKAKAERLLDDLKRDVRQGMGDGGGDDGSA